jgi:uncharacterized Zn finger protein
MKIIRCPDCGGKILLHSDMTSGYKQTGRCRDCGLFIEKTPTGYSVRREKGSYFVSDSSYDATSSTSADYWRDER